jgi:hypothetical protein
MIVNIDLAASTHADRAGCISFQTVIRSSAGKYGAQLTLSGAIDINLTASLDSCDYLGHISPPLSALE